MSEVPDNISPEDRQAIDRAFKNVDEVYVVHTGSFSNKDGTDQGIAGAVCTRVKEEDAQEIAKMLNEAQEGVYYLRWAASACFPDVQGGRSELEKAVADTQVQDMWEEIAAPHRKDLYHVAHLKIQDQSDVEKFNQELNKNKQ